MIQRIFIWLEGWVSSFPDTPPKQPPRRFWAFIWHYTRPFWPLILASSALAATVAFIEVYLFAFIGKLVDWLANADKSAFWQAHQDELWLMAAITIGILPVVRFFHESLMHQGLMANYPMRIRWQAHRYLLRQSLRFFEDDFAGRIATKMMQTSLAVRETVMKISEVIVFVSVYFFSALVLFTQVDWRLSLPLLFWLIAYIGFMRYFIPRLRKVSMEQADARSVVTGRVVDSYTHIATTKMFAHARHEEGYAREGMAVFLDTAYRQMRLATLLSSGLGLINALLIFFICAIGLYLWQDDLITAGAIAFAAGLVMKLQGMSHWVLWEVAHLFENIGVVQDGIGTLAKKREIVDASNAAPLTVTRGEICFDRVRFHYDPPERDDPELDELKPQKKAVLDDLSLTIAPQEKIGLVGRSGAGKSTLVNTLLRFYDIDSGVVRIDEQNIAQVSQESLRAQIGTVTQDTSLLHRSVLENIRYGRSDASKEEVVSAAKAAHAHDFIVELGDAKGNTGYAAEVGERGVKLSGGQRQRIAIARVLLKNAPIFLLDEATSALDSEVEADIQASLREFMADKTVIAIAHRLSTIAMMDRLIVMDQGKIIEQGSHTELLAQKGLYAELWSRQSGGFLELD